MSTTNERHRQKRLALARYILALPRSMWFNFRHLPFAQARHLPILISHRTVIENFSGTIELHAERLRMGLVKIGFSTYQQSDFRYDRGHLNIRGKMVVDGECDIASGCGIEVAETGTLRLGDRSHIGPKSLVICHKEIVLGPQTRCSWCCSLMDTDQHALLDGQGNRVNPDRPILLSEKIWIGCHTLISKGTQLPPHTTVGAGSIVFGRHTEPHTILAGNPATVIKRGVTREDFGESR